MSSSESFDSVATYTVKREPKRTASEILSDLKADDNISDGEYNSDDSVEMMVDSDDEFSFFDDDDGVDLCVVGNQMAVEKVDSNKDVDGFLPDRTFFLPKVITASHERVDARNSSYENDQLVREEMEKMDKEKVLQENKLIMEEMEIMERQKKRQEKLNMKPYCDEMKTSQNKATSSPKGNTDIIRTTKDLYRMNKENEKNVSPKQQLFYGNMIRSTLDPTRAGTPIMYKKDPITDAQRKQLLTRSDKVNISKPHDQHLQQPGTSSGHSLAESSSGHGSLPSSSILLPTTSSSSGHGSLPSSSILLPTVSSCRMPNVTAIQRERQTEVLDAIDIGQQEIRPTNEVMHRSQRNPPISERRRHLRRQARAFSEPKKPNLLKRIQTRLVRFERFIRKRLMSLSCTRGSEAE